MVVIGASLKKRGDRSTGTKKRRERSRICLQGSQKIMDKGAMEHLETKKKLVWTRRATGVDVGHRGTWGFFCHHRK